MHTPLKQHAPAPAEPAGIREAVERFARWIEAGCPPDDPFQLERSRRRGAGPVSAQS